MNLRTAMLCLDDDEIFEGDACPRCLNRISIPVRKWLVPVVAGIGTAKIKKTVRQEVKSAGRIKMVAKG